jgi:cbb3-type cytochrome oxidase maturation protein
MSVIFIVLPLALLVVLVAVIAFLWAARHGQFDDLTTPAMRALHEDPPRHEEPRAPEESAPSPPRALVGRDTGRPEKRILAKAQSSSATHSRMSQR